MTKSGRSILKSFGYLLSAHWVRELLNTAFMITLARHSTETYGQFMLAISTGQLLLMGTEFGLNQHLSAMMARREDYPSRILGQVTLIKSLFLAVGWLVMLGFIFTQDYSPQLRLIILIIGTGLALDGISNSFYTACQVLGRQDVESRSRGVASLLGYGYGLVSLLLGIPATVVALYKNVETFTGMIMVMRPFFARVRKEMRLDNLREIWGVWREGLVFTAMAVCAGFYNKINLFFLQNYAGEQGVAQYSATWQLVDGVSSLVVTMLLSRVMFPLFAKYWARDRETFAALARSSAAWLVSVGLPVSYFLFAESDLIIPLVYGSEYGEAIIMQKHLVGCILFAFVHNLAHYLMVSMRHQRILLAMYMIGLVVNLIACMVLIPNDPLIGTANTILLTKGVMALMTVGFCQVTMRLFSFRTVRNLGLTVGAAAAIHFGLSGLIPKSLVVLLTLAPMLYHAWRLYRKQQALSIVEPRDS